MQFVFELRPVNWRLKLAASETPVTYPRHKGSLGPATLRGPHQVISSLPSTKCPLGYWALACMVAAHNKAQARIDRIEVPVQAANQSLSMMMGRTAGNSWPSRGNAHLGKKVRARAGSWCLMDARRPAQAHCGKN